jgi:hypothetical protein
MQRAAALQRVAWIANKIAEKRKRVRKDKLLIFFFFFQIGSGAYPTAPPVGGPRIPSARLVATAIAPHYGVFFDLRYSLFLFDQIVIAVTDSASAVCKIYDSR